MITNRGKGTHNITHKAYELWQKSDRKHTRAQWYKIITTVCEELRKLCANMISVHIPRFGQLDFIRKESIVRKRTRLNGEVYFVDHRYYNFEDGTRRNGFYIFGKLINTPNDKKLCYFIPTKNLTREIKNVVFDCNYKIYNDKR